LVDVTVDTSRIYSPHPRFLAGRAALSDAAIEKSPSRL
jgi:hypothetical protein